jgi:HD-GYP domain-containing protein (c-di-GMP phosphodiesterase class II)
MVFFRSTSRAVAPARTAPPASDVYLAMLAVLANAVEARNAYSSGHTGRVTRLAQAAARYLGFDERELATIELAGILHDIGEIGVPDRILTKPGPLTPEEEDHMMRHPEIGARLLRSVPDLEHLVPAVLHHHERFDGSGYPNGLVEHAIPIEARLLAAADALDAMTTDRPYRARLAPPTAMAELVDRAGSQFDPEVVEAFELAYRAGELDDVLGTRTADAALPLSP